MCQFIFINHANVNIRPSVRQGAFTSAMEKLICSFPVEALDYGHSLLTAHCCICQHSYQRGDWVRELPCTHKVLLLYIYCSNVMLQMYSIL